MKLPAYTLLKRLIVVRELSLLEAKELITQKFGDFRDWYPVAGLVKQGYLANPFVGVMAESITEKEIASMLFGKTLGHGRHKVNNITAVNQGDSISLSATSKADLYFAELRAKRNDRTISALIAVAIGVSSALLTFYAKEHFAINLQSSANPVVLPNAVSGTEFARKIAQDCLR